MTKVQTDRCAARENREKRRKIMKLPTDPFARQPLSERIREAEELADFDREHGTPEDFKKALAKVNKLKKKAKEAKRRADEALSKYLKALSM
jgi:hypothetical protein